MPAKYRLTRSDFTQMRSFKRVHGEFFSYSYGAIPGRKVSGGACVVSKKVAKSAVVRNRIKRRVRSALLALLGQLSTPLVVVCYAKKAAVAADATAITEEMGRISSKIV